MIEVPPLHPCPKCGLPVEEGTSPFGLAFHSCEFVTQLRLVSESEPTIEATKAVLLRQIQAKAYDATPRELREMLEALQERDAGGSSGEAGNTKDERDWLLRE